MSVGDNYTRLYQDRVQKLFDRVGSIYETNKEDKQHKLDLLQGVLKDMEKQLAL